MYKIAIIIFSIYSLIADITFAEVNNSSMPNERVAAPKEHKEPLEFIGVWARPSMVASGNSAIYLTIKNNSNKEYHLIGASALGIANNIELHGTFTNPQGVAQMRNIDKILIPAQTQVILKPGGTHIMLFNLKQNLTIDKKFNLNLRFLEQEIGIKTITVTVQNEA